MDKAQVATPTFTEYKKANAVLIQNRLTANRLTKIDFSYDKQVLDIYIEYLELIGEADKIFSDETKNIFIVERENHEQCNRKESDDYYDLTHKQNIFCLIKHGLYN